MVRVMQAVGRFAGARNVVSGQDFSYCCSSSGSSPFFCFFFLLLLLLGIFFGFAGKASFLGSLDLDNSAWYIQLVVVADLPFSHLLLLLFLFQLTDGYIESATLFSLSLR